MYFCVMVIFRGLVVEVVKLDKGSGNESVQEPYAPLQKTYGHQYRMLSIAPHSWLLGKGPNALGVYDRSIRRVSNDRAGFFKPVGRFIAGPRAPPQLPALPPTSRAIWVSTHLGRYAIRGPLDLRDLCQCLAIVLVALETPPANRPFPSPSSDRPLASSDIQSPFEISAAGSVDEHHNERSEFFARCRFWTRT